ncbi:MAG TPA: glycosyltransferase, partial [Thermoplasmata archaeon]|nr:glycosyltransferase [Thermoplasmata archaeon]
MRIAQVAFRFDAPGGVETTVRELARRLQAAGDAVEVYASDLYDEARWERRAFPPEVEGIPVHRFRAHRRLLPGLTLPMLVGLVDALA